MIPVDLLNNISLLLALSIVYRFIVRRWNLESANFRILSGLIFGAASIVGMMNPLVFRTGVIIDGRSVILSMAGLFGGPLAAGPAAVIASAYRLYLGGAGAWTGVLVSFVSAGLGVGYHYWRHVRPEALRPLYLYLFGMLVHLAMLAGMLTLPGVLTWEALHALFFPTLIIFPLATLAMGALLADLERQIATEKGLAESERRYRLLAEHSTDMIIRHLADGKVLYVSPAARSLFGYEKNEIMGKEPYEFIHPDDQEKVRAFQKNIISKKLATSVVYRVRHKDGSYLWVETTGQTLINEASGNLEIITNTRDINRRKQVEESLAESEQRLEMSVRAANVGLWDWDLSTNKVYYSPEWKRQIGYEPDEISDDFDEWQSRVHPDDLDRALTEIREYLENPLKYFDLDFRFRHKDGSYRWILARASLVKNESGKLSRMMGLHLDITDRKKTEEALRINEAQFRAMFHSAPIGIVLMGPSGEVIYANEAHLRMIGALLGGAVQKHWFQAIHAEDRDRIKSDWQAAMDNGWPYRGMGRYLHDDGRVVWWDLRTSPVRDDDKLLGHVAMVADVTEQKTAEDERDRLQDKLRQAQKMEAIGTLAGGIAHDFNNILSAVLGFTELAMLRVERGTELFNELREIMKAGKRAKGLVQQILTFSRQSAQESTMLLPGPIAIEALRMLRASLPASIEIRQEITSKGVILGDPTQIHQVLLNLCTNAAHAMSDGGGVLTVRLEDVNVDFESAGHYPDLKTGPYVCLSVNDTGMGISPEVKDKIFDPFFTTKAKGEGTGMGLPVVHGIAQSHGGAVYCYSELGHGSTFNVYFPITESRATVAYSPKIQPPTGHERILLVDDEQAIVNMEKQTLESLGYEVVARTSSVDALELFQDDPDRFDLVITDMTMPKMSGDSLALEMMKIRPKMPIILCTGFSSRINEKRAAAMGIGAMLFKPLLRQELAEKIREVLDGPNE